QHVLAHRIGKLAAALSAACPHQGKIWRQGPDWWPADQGIALPPTGPTTSTAPGASAGVIYSSMGVRLGATVRRILRPVSDARPVPRFFASAHSALPLRGHGLISEARSHPESAIPPSGPRRCTPR